jgi:hypothetical protein
MKDVPVFQQSGKTGGFAYHRPQLVATAVPAAQPTPMLIRFRSSAGGAEAPVGQMSGKGF